MSDPKKAHQSTWSRIPANQSPLPISNKTEHLHFNAKQILE